jgi:hypothetical protein
MTLKHINFDNSEVMRELERLDAKKNPGHVWKPKSLEKKASIKHTGDLFHDMIMLVASLREAGKISEANRLQEKISLYKKAENVHLYRAIDEDGEDLLEFAHPEGDVEVAPSANGYGKVETLLGQHKKIVDMIQKSPTGKQASAKDTLLAKVAKDLGLEKRGQEAGAIKKLNDAAEMLSAVITRIGKNNPKYEFGGGIVRDPFIELVVSGESSFSRIILQGTGNATTPFKFNKPDELNAFRIFAGAGIFDAARMDYEKKITDETGSNDDFERLFTDCVTNANANIKKAFAEIQTNVSLLTNTNLSPDQLIKVIDKVILLLGSERDRYTWILDLWTGYNDEWMALIRSKIQNVVKAATVVRSEISKNQLSLLDSALQKYKEATNLNAKWNTTNGNQKQINQRYIDSIITAIIKIKTANTQELNEQLTFLKSSTDYFGNSFSNISVGNYGKMLLDDSVETLNKIQTLVTTKSAAQKSQNIKKLATPPEAPAPAPAAPAAQITSQSNQSRTQYVNNVTKWQQAQDPNYIQAVKYLQRTLQGLGQPANLETIKKTFKDLDISKASNLLNSIGQGDWAGQAAPDGMWGKRTTDALREANFIIGLYDKKYKLDLDNVPESVVKTANTPDLQKQWGKIATSYAEKILSFMKVNQFDVPEQITGAPGAATNTLLDKISKVDILNSNPKEDFGDELLYSSDLTSLKSLDNWLVNHGLLNPDIKLDSSKWWSRLFDFFDKRIQFNKTSGTEDKTISLYENLINKLKDSFRSIAGQLTQGRQYLLSEIAGKSNQSVGAPGISTTQPRQTTPAEGMTVEQLEEDKNNVNMVIGSVIYPKNWGVQFGGLDPYIPAQIAYNSLSSAANNLNQLSNILIRQQAQASSWIQKLEFLRKNPGDALPPHYRTNQFQTWGQISNIPQHPLYTQVERQFATIILQDIIKAIKININIISNQYSEKYARTHQAFADSIMKNAGQWQNLLDDALNTAVRAYNQMEWGQGSSPGI